MFDPAVVDAFEMLEMARAADRAGDEVAGATSG